MITLSLAEMSEFFNQRLGGGTHFKSQRIHHRIDDQRFELAGLSQIQGQLLQQRGKLLGLAFWHWKKRLGCRDGPGT